MEVSVLTLISGSRFSITSEVFSELWVEEDGEVYRLLPSALEIAMAMPPTATILLMPVMARIF